MDYGCGDFGMIGKIWYLNPKVWIERERLESNAYPLLKNRKRERRGLEVKLWMELLSTGWRRVPPQWD